MLNKRTVEDLEVKSKSVLVRVDFNVPMDKEGRITDDRRIREALPTINYLKEKGAKVILMSHLGRPKGKVNPQFSLKPVAERLSELLGQQVIMCDDVVGEDAYKKSEALDDGDVIF